MQPKSQHMAGILEVNTKMSHTPHHTSLCLIKVLRHCTNCLTMYINKLRKQASDRDEKSWCVKENQSDVSEESGLPINAVYMVQSPGH